MEQSGDAGKWNAGSFSAGDTVVVGLSGGADSVALTHWLQFGCPVRPLHVAACHVNHGLRGEESERDEAFVRSLCEQWDIPLFVRRADIRTLAKEQSLGLEECGRFCRYAFFEETADRLQSQSAQTWIATAHTQSDNAETVLFRLTRGTALKGLCGIPPVRGRIVRPMLNLSRADVEAYCIQHNLRYVTDSSNLTTDYARNKIRHQVLPVLREINSGAEHNIAGTIAVLAQEQDFLEQQAAQAYERVRGSNGLLLSPLTAEHPAMQSRVLVRFLQENALPVSQKKVQELLRLVQTGAGQINLCRDRFVRIRENRLEVGNALPFSPKKWPDSGKTLPCDGIFESATGKRYKIQTLETTVSETFNKIYKNLFDISIDCGKICGSAVIRQRLPGDRVKLRTAAHTKSLKKLFQEHHIPPEQRQARFVLSDDEGILAVEGLGTALRVCCDASTRRCLQLTEIE